jgi:hypothetical protein
MTLAQVVDLSTPLDPAFLAAINSENPFDRPLFVKQQHIWEREFFDVPELNADASNFVLQAVSQIRAGRRSTLGITLTAERGLGKSHIISRIRHSLVVGEAAFFIYMGEYNDLSRIKEEFLQSIAYSLKHSMRSDYMQWQELATVMCNRAMQKQYAAKHLVDDIIPKQIKVCQQNGSSILHNITHLRKQFLTAYPHIQNPYLVQAIFWTLSKAHAVDAINWIAGNGITPADAMAMGLPVANEESDSFNAFTQAQEILNLLGEFMPVVICFDELDAPQESEADRPSVVAGLGKDVLNNLKRGIVLTTIWPETWISRIKVMPQSNAVVDRIGEKVIELKHLNPDSVKALVSNWLDEFYFEKKYRPTTPIYPFTAEEMHIIGDERPTFRAALQDCRQIFGEKINIKPKEHPVRVAYEAEFEAISKNIDDWMDNSSKIADALRLGFSAAVGETIGGIKVQAVEDFENLKGNDLEYVDFRVIAKEEGTRLAKIAVSVMQVAGGSTLTATLKRLLNYEKLGVNRSCLVRSKPINLAAKQAHNLVTQLIGEKKGEWVNLVPDQIQPLLAINEVYERMEDYELTEAQILDFINHQSLVSGNPLLEEILSKPSGKVPKDLVDANELITTPSNGEDICLEMPLNDEFGWKQKWIYDISQLADRSIEEDLGAKSNYHAGTDFEIIVRTSLEFLGFTVDYSHVGGAGGLDLYCSQPFPVIGECKSGKGIPSGAVEELLKLGRMHLDANMSAECFDSVVKIIIGPGKPTADLQKAAEAWKVSIISANALQKLVELKALYPGTFQLGELKNYFKPGFIDEQIDRFIDEKIVAKLAIYNQITTLLQSTSVSTPEQAIGFNQLVQNFRIAHPNLVSVTDRQLYEMMLELASPLVGYLGRIKGQLWDQDRFYLLRELQIS